MGVSNSNRSNRKYLSIVGGKFAERSEESVQGAVKRINKKGNEVWELLWDQVSGKITEMAIEESEYGQQLRITVDDGVEPCVVTLQVESKYFRHFVQKIDGVTLSELVELRPFSFTDKKDVNKVISGFNIYQDGTKIDWQVLEGKPTADPNVKMKDADFKIFQIQESEFLKEYFIRKYCGSPAPGTADTKSLNAEADPDFDKDAVDAPF